MKGFIKKYKLLVKIFLAMILGFLIGQFFSESFVKEPGRGRLKGNKPNVHAQTERSSSRKSGGASLYKKSGSGKKAERF